MPNPPTNPTISLRVQGLALAWTASAGGADSYSIYRSLQPSCFTQIASTTSTTYTDSDVLNGQTYYYYITAVTGTTESSSTNTLYFMFTGVTPYNTDTRDSGTALTHKKDLTLSSGIVPNGGGESVRIARLKGNLYKCIQ